MIDTPHIVQSEAQIAAVIHLTIPREQIRHAMGPAIGDVLKVIATQGIGPSGPCFSYHYTITATTFDFDIGFPVRTPVKPTGHVKEGSLPSLRVARTIHRGPYTGLHDAWMQFKSWMAANSHTGAGPIWERYLSGPETSQNPADWQTELNCPIS